MALKLIIDTDPGIDDAMAILYAIAAPEIDLLGLTTVFGNVTTPKATRNALYLLRGSRSLWPKGCTALVYFLPFRQPLRCMGRRALERSPCPRPSAARWLRLRLSIWCGWHGRIKGSCCSVPLVL